MSFTEDILGLVGTQHHNLARTMTSAATFMQALLNDLQNAPDTGSPKNPPGPKHTSNKAGQFLITTACVPANRPRTFTATTCVYSIRTAHCSSRPCLCMHVLSAEHSSYTFVWLCICNFWRLPIFANCASKFTAITMSTSSVQPKLL